MEQYPIFIYKFSKQGVMFPSISIPAKIIKDKEIELIKASQALYKKNIIVVSQKNESKSPKIKDLYSVGVLCEVQILDDNEIGLDILMKGNKRVKIKEFKEDNDVLYGKIEYLEDEVNDEHLKTAILLDNLRMKTYEFFLKLQINFINLYTQLQEIKDPSILCYFVVASLEDLTREEKQKVLEENNINKRQELVLQYLSTALEKMSIQEEIDQKTNVSFSKNQREVYLRRQLAEIKKELGETDEIIQDDYSDKIVKAGMPQDIKKIALDELRKLENTSPNGSEYSVIKNYLDHLIAMPWQKSTQDQLDINKIQEKLDIDHYGLEKPKKRIIEQFAIAKLKDNKVKGSILCFVGAPGVGKTSFAKSIAESIGRSFIRISLGGVRDESEIRGHRRTYVGAMPGKIIQAIKRAKTNNPLILLDEVDKMGASNQGDPASALLEVLDPEQNFSFTDHYLDVPFDLSNVFFIATANYLENIPEPLKDRMEIITLPSYSFLEKEEILKKYIIPQCLKETGLTDNQVFIDPKVMTKIILNYTKESGVRSLKRTIMNIFRWSAVEFIKSNQKVMIDESKVIQILGNSSEKYLLPEKYNPGTVTGLAWTAYGGDCLKIETIKMDKGKGKFTITGQLGDVMKESIQIASSYIKLYKKEFGVENFEFDKFDYHLHVPAGAIKKDGPSAGVAMFVSLLSLFKDQAIDPKISMTGEITLSGDITAIGGIKEKMSAAYLSGIKEIYLSQDNENDVNSEVSDEIKKNIKINYVKNLKEIYKLIFTR